jgi:hypothetical protein
MCPERSVTYVSGRTQSKTIVLSRESERPYIVAFGPAPIAVRQANGAIRSIYACTFILAISVLILASDWFAWVCTISRHLAGVTKPLWHRTGERSCRAAQRQFASLRRHSLPL